MKNFQFTFSFNTSSTWITWSLPSFYSNDIPQSSITTYHFIVKSQNGSEIVDVNTTDTFYELPSNYIGYCDIYTASVTAVIEQYSSLVTTIAKENIGSKIVLLFSF